MKRTLVNVRGDDTAARRRRVRERGVRRAVGGGGRRRVGHGQQRENTAGGGRHTFASFEILGLTWGTGWYFYWYSKDKTRV